MKRIQKFIKNRIELLLDVKNSMNEKNFQLVVITSAVVYFVLFFLLIALGKDSSLLIFDVLLEVMLLCMVGISAHTKETRFFSNVYCILLNFLILPIFFFALGDIYSGVALLFILGIIATVFLQSGSKLLPLIVALEFVSDVFCMLFAYFNRGIFSVTRAEINTRQEITVCFIIVALCVTFLTSYQAYIYRVTRDRLNEANKEIYVAQSSRTRFLANMTHEIRTPMNAILGMTNLILREDISNDVKDHVETIKDNSTQLLRIINDILEFSKLDSGKVSLLNTEYNFSALFSEIVNSVSAEYLKNNIELYVYVGKNIPQILFGDDIKIRQIFRYLLFSSLSQSEYGSTYINIDGDFNEDDQTINISCRIASTGPGFSEAEINSMFNAYSDYDSRQKSSFKGMGLELNICRSILKLMNGDLSIESIEGIGTAVSFNFENYVFKNESIISNYDKALIKPLIYVNRKDYEPKWIQLMESFGVSTVYVRNVVMLKRALENTHFTHIYVHETCIDEVKNVLKDFECEDITYVIASFDKAYGDFDDLKLLRIPVYAINLLESFNGSWNEEDYKRHVDAESILYPDARVLIVDDSLINLKVEESLLSGYGIKPRLASSGYEALDILKHEEFDLVLLDQKMPEFDGIETIHALRNSDFEQRNIPVICVTADFGSGIRESLKNEGFDDYLSKPINLTYFNRILKAFLPEELRQIKNSGSETNVVEENIKTNSEAVNDATEENIYFFDPEIGIKNLGNNEEAYISVLQAYYQEGLDKIINVPQQFLNGDISLYTTNVHALKSSSATVGAMGISPKFKALEFAGKDNNIDFIKENSTITFEAFEKVLDAVKEYLISKDSLPDEGDTFDEDSEVCEMNTDILNELSGCISSMNLRRSEEIINELSSNNYGKELNQQIKKIKDSYDNFDYMDIIEVLNDMIN